MAKSSLYTKTGDSGETSLVSGKRVLKSNQRIDLYGEVDELNSNLGVVIHYLKVQPTAFENIINILSKVQHELFNLGSRLACESELWEKYQLPAVGSTILSEMEESLDFLDNEMPKLKSFILPGGTNIACFSHVARTVCRRVERSMVDFRELGNEAPENALKLLNRLSDYLFVVARYSNFKFKISDEIWQATSN